MTRLSARRRIIAAIVLASLGIAGLAAAAIIGPWAVRVERIAADPDEGYHADFYLYVSPAARRAAQRGESVALLVQPNNSGRTTDDPAIHRRDAWWMGFERRRVADELGVALLVPAFVRPVTGWQVYTHALDRDVLTTERPALRRLDLQLLAMIGTARRHLAATGVRLEPRILLMGFSASGMFANRFTALHPSVVQAVAVGSPGGWPIAPTRTVAGESLPYPAGIADLAPLTGSPFDSAAFAAVPQLIVMGDQDDNDGLDFQDGWEAPAAAQVERLFGARPIDRWAAAQRLYESVGATARFVLRPGIGHDRVALQPLMVEFLAEQRRARRSR